MPDIAPVTIFRLHLAFGYLAIGLLVLTYVVPRLRAIAIADAQRAIATLHSFRFFGLVFLLPGFVGAVSAPSHVFRNLPRQRYTTQSGELQ